MAIILRSIDEDDKSYILPPPYVPPPPFLQRLQRKQLLESKSSSKEYVKPVELAVKQMVITEKKEKPTDINR